MVTSQISRCFNYAMSLGERDFARIEISCFFKKSRDNRQKPRMVKQARRHL